jgi:16S rRNA (guanine1207-N2)-methyltransferase
LEGLPERRFDLVLANPPYFSDFRIAESFARAAQAALVRGGELRLVAKAAAAHAAVVRREFGEARIEECGDYGVVRARVL